MEISTYSNQRKSSIPECIEKSRQNSNKITSDISRTIKAVIFIFCLGGLTYQQTQFLTHFFTHPTVMNFELMTPESFVAPAFTFCNTNPVQRSKYCRKFKGACIKPHDIESFCSYLPHFCNGNETDYIYPNPDDKSGTGWLGKDDIKKLGQEPASLFHLETRPRGLQTVFFEDKSGFFRKCYSDNIYLENKREAKIKKFDPPLRGSHTTSVKNYTLDVDMDEQFDFTVQPGILLSVHSPFVAFNPHFKGVLMKPGMQYKIHIRLEEERLLPQPYKTDCIDYVDTWRKNNNTGPRSQQMCKERCQSNFSLSCYGCFKDLSVYESLSVICQSRTRWRLPRALYRYDYGYRTSCVGEEEMKEDLQQCIQACKKECLKLKYHFTAEERTAGYTIKKLEERNVEVEYGRAGQSGGYTIERDYFGDSIMVEVFVDDPEILVASHKPQYVKVELFSYIGGFMGCWLGISLWDLAGILQNMRSTVVKLFKALKFEDAATKQKMCNV